MMTNRRLTLVWLCLLLAFLTWGGDQPVQASQSFYETLSDTADEGVGSEEALPAPEVGQPVVDPDQGVAPVETPAWNPADVQNTINGLIQKGLSSLGLASPAPSGTAYGIVDTLKAVFDRIKKKFQVACNPGAGAKWTATQLEWVESVLASLPASFRNMTKTILRDNGSNMKGVLGWVRLGVPTVHMLNLTCSTRTKFMGTLVHEMTHTWQAKNNSVLKKWQSTFWKGNKPKKSSVSWYGNTKAIEDMAESVRVYWETGDKMAKSHPDRYEFIKKYVMRGKEF